MSKFLHPEGRPIIAVTRTFDDRAALISIKDAIDERHARRKTDRGGAKGQVNPD